MLGFNDDDAPSASYGLIGSQRRERWSTTFKAFSAFGALAALALLVSNQGE